VRAAGLREYYDPYTGEGMGATDFSWSALVMELIDPDSAAASSHLGASARSSSSTNAVANRAAPSSVAGQRFSGRSEGQ
jgi:hypothetical protein